ncbi:MAG: AAA family ATPase, partial [Burkholderiales bacterium]
MELAGATQGGATRPLPSWALDWVMLRKTEHALPGSPSANVQLYVPVTIGQVANDARLRLSFRDHGDDVGKLRALALLSPLPTNGKTDQADLPIDASPSLPAHRKPAVSPAVAAAPGPGASAPAAKPRSPVRLPGVRVRIMTDEALQRYRAELEVLGKRKSRDDAKGDRELSAALVARGGLRTVVLARTWRAGLDRLAADMPNFATVVAQVRRCCTVARLTGRPLHIAPFLLAGTPGLGKTLFATRLAGALAVPQFVYALDSAETMATLTGSDKHWANTEPGQLFRLIVLGEVANPVVVLDELDKASRGSGSSSSYRPATALHGPLEPLTAKALRDKSADLCFDASHVIYIATANRLSSIEGSLLSRFKLFHIEEPDARTAVAIARSVARSVLGEFGLARRFEAVTGEVLQQLA